MRKNESWQNAVGAWVPLAHLLERIEQTLGIPQASAVGKLRQALEILEVRTRIVGWNSSEAVRLGRRQWIAEGDPRYTSLFCVSEEGWRHVDWDAGTLSGKPIEVLWKDIKDQFSTFFAADWPKPVNTADAPPGRGASVGRPAKHDWDAFWIEVALYAAKNDLEPPEREPLQQHMQSWVLQWHSPPDDATIRKKLKRLFDARKIAV